MYYTAASMLVAFTLTLVLVKRWIPVAHRIGMVGKDMNKPGNIMVAEAGGMWAIVSASFGLVFLEALYVYLKGVYYEPLHLYSLVTMLLLASLLGFMDDVLGWKKGLARRYRVLLMAPISLPLVVIKAGKSVMDLPLVGPVDFGLAYPLILVPIGVLGAANAFNMIAGYNGLEAGMGLLLMLYTAAYALMKGVPFVPSAALIMAAALLGFLVYNWYPAKVFPGNGFTYGVGAYYAGLVIIGNMEKFGVALFTLYFVKAAMYFYGLAKGVWKGGIEDFGVPRPDGTLEAPLRGPYSLQHLTIRLLARLTGRATERGVVLFILGLQAVIGAVLLALAWRGLI